MTLSLVSKNGRPLPLRALPWRDLNREFWSQGKTVYPQPFHEEPRELTAFEKTIDVSSMTLEDLIATADAEPLSESRRAWLTRGAGVASLAPWDSYDEGSLGATIVDPTAQAALEAIGLPLLDRIEAEFADEASSVGNGTAYELPDPVVAKQIEREQINAMNGPAIRVHLSTSESGKLAINTDRKLMPEELLRVARSVKRTLASTFGTCATLDDLHERVDLIRESLNASGVTIDVTPDWREERARMLEPADPEWHSAYEFIQPSIGWKFFEGTIVPDCMRPTCDREYEHVHERITRQTHRRPQNVGSQDEFWRTTIFDITAFELGTEGLVDPLVTR